jgi:hypothetical protein
MNQVNCTKTYATPSYYTEVPKYYTEKAEYCATAYAVTVYYTEKPKCYSAATNTKQRLRFITPPRSLSITLQLTLLPSYYTEVPKYYSAPSYQTTKAPECYTTIFASSFV